MEAMGKQQRVEELFRAAREGNIRLLKKMARALDSGGLGEAAVLAATVDDDGASVLHMASKHGRVDVLRYLVEDLRLDINQLNSLGDTPLFYSAFFGRAAAVIYLLDHGADPLVGKSVLPLHGAAGEGLLFDALNLLAVFPSALSETTAMLLWPERTAQIYA